MTTMRMTDEWKDRKIALLKDALSRLTICIHLAEINRQEESNCHLFRVALVASSDWEEIVKYAKEAEELL